MDSEQASIDEFALGLKCPSCEFTGFDPNGVAFYTAPGQYEYNCQNCGYVVRLGYDSLPLPGGLWPPKIVIKGERERCRSARSN